LSVVVVVSVVVVAAVVGASCVVGAAVVVASVVVASIVVLLLASLPQAANVIVRVAAASPASTLLLLIGTPSKSRCAASVELMATSGTLASSESAASHIATEPQVPARRDEAKTTWRTIGRPPQKLGERCLADGR
jgi:hypothetical protein